MSSDSRGTNVCQTQGCSHTALYGMFYSGDKGMRKLCSNCHVATYRFGYHPFVMVSAVGSMKKP